MTKICKSNPLTCNNLSFKNSNFASGLIGNCLLDNFSSWQLPWKIGWHLSTTAAWREKCLIYWFWLYKVVKDYFFFQIFVAFSEYLNLNGILLPKLFWPTVRKNCSSDREIFWNSRLKAENLQKFCDHQNNLFKQWKGRTILGNKCSFNLFLEVFQI